MDKIKKINNYRIVFQALIAVGILFALFMSILMLKYYDPEIQYFENGTALPLIYTILAFVFVVVSFVSMAMIKYTDLPSEYENNSVVVKVVSTLCAVVLAGASIYSVGYLLTSDAQGLFGSRMNIVTTASAIFGVVFAFYFLLIALYGNKEENIKCLCGCIGIVFIIMRLLMLYYDLSGPINSPVRILEQLANVAAMMFFVYELRLIMNHSKPRLLASFGVIAFMLLLNSGLSQIVYALVEKNDLNIGLFYALFELVLSIYILCRLITFVFDQNKKIIN